MSKFVTHTQPTLASAQSTRKGGAKNSPKTEAINESIENVQPRFHEPGWDNAESRAYSTESDLTAGNHLMRKADAIEAAPANDSAQGESCGGKEKCLTPEKALAMAKIIDPIIELIIKNAEPVGSLKEDMDYNISPFQVEARHFEKWQTNIYLALQNLSGVNVPGLFNFDVEDSEYDLDPKQEEKKGDITGWVDKKFDTFGKEIEQDKARYIDPFRDFQVDLSDYCKCCFKLEGPYGPENVTPLFAPRAADSMPDADERIESAANPGYEVDNPYKGIENVSTPKAYEQALLDLLKSNITSPKLDNFQASWQKNQTKLREEELRKQFIQLYGLRVTPESYQEWRDNEMKRMEEKRAEKENKLTTQEKIEREKRRLEGEEIEEEEMPTEHLNFYATEAEKQALQEWLKLNEAFGIKWNEEIQEFQRISPQKPARAPKKYEPEGNEEFPPKPYEKEDKNKFQPIDTDLTAPMRESEEFDKKEAELRDKADHYNRMLDLDDNFVTIIDLDKIKLEALVQLSGELINRQKWKNIEPLGAMDYNEPDSKDPRIVRSQAIHKEWARGGTVKENARTIVPPQINGDFAQLTTFAQIGNYGYAREKHYRDFGVDSRFNYDENKEYFDKSIPETMTWMVHYQLKLNGDPRKDCKE